MEKLFITNWSPSKEIYLGDLRIKPNLRASITYEQTTLYLDSILIEIKDNKIDTLKLR